MRKFVKEFCKLSKDSEVKQNFDLYAYNTFKLKAKAKIYIKIGSFADLTYMLMLAKKYNIRVYCLGGGSKVLLPPIFQGIIYTLSFKYTTIERIGNRLFVGAGLSMSALCGYCIRNNLSCVEWGLGIPGSVGGGVFMNAGCYGYSFADIVAKVIYTDGKKLYSRMGSECEFGYRKSFFQTGPYTILYVLLNVKKSSDIKNKTLDYYKQKTSSQPYEYGSVGSIFKQSILPAPLFIQAYGLKGLKIGGAEVSTKHCGFIVNRKNCTQKQVLKIIYKIKKTVWKKGAILLHNEVILLGGKNGIFRRLSYPHNI